MRQILKPINAIKTSPQVNSCINSSGSGDKCCRCCSCCCAMSASAMRVPSSSCAFSCCSCIDCSSDCSGSGNGNSESNSRKGYNNNSNNNNTCHNAESTTILLCRRSSSNQKENCCPNQMTVDKQLSHSEKQPSNSQHVKLKHHHNQLHQMHQQSFKPKSPTKQCNLCESTSTSEYTIGSGNKSNSNRPAPIRSNKINAAEPAVWSVSGQWYGLWLILFSLVQCLVAKSIFGMSHRLAKCSDVLRSIKSVFFKMSLKPAFSLPSVLSPSSSLSSRFFKSDFAIYSVVALVAALCFSNSLYGDFVHDDIPAIVQNPDVIGTSPISELFLHDFWGKLMSDPDSHKSYRPITTLTFRFNMLLSVRTFGFHLVNLILHTVVSLMVCRLARKLLHFDAKLTLFVATLFAAHPIHCEAVSSLVGRADALCALFYLLAFFAFHDSLRPSQSIQSQLVSLMVCLVCSTLATFSKETGITAFGVSALYWLFVQLPSLLPYLSHLRQAGGSSRSLYRLKLTHYVVQQFIPILSISLAFVLLLVMRLRLLGGTLPFFSEQDNPASYSKSTLTRFLTYFHLAVFNVHLMISPDHQAYDWQTGSIHLVSSLADRRNAGSLCLLGALVAMVYRIGHSFVVDIGQNNNNQPTELQWSDLNQTEPLVEQQQSQTDKQQTRRHCTDRQCSTPTTLYSPSRTLLVSILFLVLPYMPASNIFVTVGFVVAERLLYIPSIGFVCLIGLGLKQLEDSSQQRSIWQASLRRTSGLCRLVVACLIAIFVLKTTQQNRVWSSRQTLYKSGIINVPENAKAHYNYANLQQDIGNFDNAMHHYQTAIRLWPQHASAHNNLGALFWKILEPDNAERHFNAALKINPYHAKAHFNLGKVYSKRGQIWEAIILMERSIGLDRRFGESYEALASLYAQLGKVAIAERLHQRALRLRPRNADFHNNYGAFLQKTGRNEYALRQYYTALLHNPNHRIALLNVANVLSVLQRYQQAEQSYKRALKLREDAPTLDLLGALYLRQSKLGLARHVYDYIWNKYSTATPATQHHHQRKQRIAKDNDSSRDKKKTQRRKLSTFSANIQIHYTQLLILEGRYKDAEVILEALTRLERQQQQQRHNHYIQKTGNNGNKSSNDDDEDDNKYHNNSNRTNQANAELDSWKQHLHRAIPHPNPSQQPQQQQQQQQSIVTNLIEYKLKSTTATNVASRFVRELLKQTSSEIIAATATGDNQNHSEFVVVWSAATENPNEESSHKTRQRLSGYIATSETNNCPAESHQIECKSTSSPESSPNDGTASYRKPNNNNNQLMLTNEQAIVLLIDVHHQLALLYTLTNRTAEALHSITEALKLCSSSNPAASTKDKTSTAAAVVALNQFHNCAQIYTLQGDIRKDLHQWPDAIESYKQAIRLNECLARPHLNLAVIYHLEDRYSEAMLHYSWAQQLDTGAHSSLIQDNISKLVRQQQQQQQLQQRQLLYQQSVPMVHRSQISICRARARQQLSHSPIGKSAINNNSESKMLFVTDHSTGYSYQGPHKQLQSGQILSLYASSRILSSL